ncbi:MAG: BlaI/MecI/CopY family transcriptional regulator [Alphaproteobacteria bacterium]|jgi:predicted transcriptional regulator|nr:BlaI/MecI/CopY family transcriptional regulator [Alphaproteobacteria bacterium]
MEHLKLGAVEMRFAEIIWKNEPLTSGQLVKLCLEQLEWKKSTTYTVLKKLCDRGLFKNTNGMVSSVISKEEYYSAQSEQVVNESFGGSLPAFIAAFTSRKTLTQEEIDEIRRMIDAVGEE